ncbi:hypothetical protein L2449_27280 [Mesorhizobium muleiense]|uniref:hypothetical protein n=1 Tax=Mesorhizobium muleiense TaxID=1004279 RepID=UPI001F2F2E18|nr:hypothetical protein [Mesorhizobium muleiense]MCF6120531.1 hypothetical protein [Mesorhizobium muleiense]
MLAQVRNVQTVAIYRGDDCMAVIYFGRHGWRRTEMALSIAPSAARHMGRLVRMAQLTLFAMAETHLIVARIRSGNHAGQRMAMLVGFHAHGNFEPGVWILRKERRHGFNTRRRWSGGGCQESGGRTEGATAGGE